MYSPQANDLDFEIGAFGDRLKKGFKSARKALTKVTDATIVKPSAMIGGAIGGKRGREWGRKLGKITAGATQIGVGAGAAGAVAPLLGSPLVHTAATGLVAHKLLSKKKKKKAKIKAHAKRHKTAKASIRHKRKAARKCSSNADAAKVAALLVEKLGKPLSEANKALKLAEIQRQATYEHERLMTDAEFRKKVITGITALASAGHDGCARTIRVLVGR